MLGELITVKDQFRASGSMAGRCYRRTVLFVILAFLAHSAWGAIVDCGRSSSPGDYWVFIDELSYNQSAFENDAQLSVFLDRLWFFLDQERERGWDETPETPIRFALCPGRRPAIDGREFDPTLVDLLNNQGVLLEIWGVLDARDDNGSIVERHARIGYLLVPLRYQYFKQNQEPAGLYFARYPGDSDGATEDFLVLFEQNQEIDTYVALGLGLKSLKRGDYDAAQKNLCKAALLLEKILPEQRLARQRSSLQRLANYARESAGEAIRLAQSRPDYVGSLSLLDPAGACPGEGP